MRGFHNLVEGLWRLGRFDEAAAELDQAESYGRDRDFPLFTLHDRRPTTPVAGRARRVGGGGGGPPRDARRRRRATPASIGHETLPALARLLVRRGADGAEAALAAAAEHAARADVLLWLVPDRPRPHRARLVDGAPGARGPVPRAAAGPHGPAGHAAVPARELLRHLRRLGHPAEPFAGCPESEAAGLRGDWRAAAAAWERAGRPYERALELAESGQPEPTLEALAVLTQLGALPAVAIVRERLRDCRASGSGRGHRSGPPWPTRPG